MSAHGSLGGSEDGSGSGIQERKGGEGGNFQLPMREPVKNVLADFVR